jgi:hypothetical protein
LQRGHAIARQGDGDSGSAQPRRSLLAAFRFDAYRFGMATRLRSLRSKPAALVAAMLGGLLLAAALTVVAIDLRDIVNGRTASGRQFMSAPHGGEIALLPFIRQLEMRHGLDPEADGGMSGIS